MITMSERAESQARMSKDNCEDSGDFRAGYDDDNGNDEGGFEGHGQGARRNGRIDWEAATGKQQKKNSSSEDADGIGRMYEDDGRTKIRSPLLSPSQVHSSSISPLSSSSPDSSSDSSDKNERTGKRKMKHTKKTRSKKGRRKEKKDRKGNGKKNKKKKDLEKKKNQYKKRDEKVGRKHTPRKSNYLVSHPFYLFYTFTIFWPTKQTFLLCIDDHVGRLELYCRL